MADLDVIGIAGGARDAGALGGEVPGVAVERTLAAAGCADRSVGCPTGTIWERSRASPRP